MNKNKRELFNPSATRYLYASVGLFTVALSVVSGTFFLSQQRFSDTHYKIIQVNELKILSQQISQSASGAAIGKEDAFSLLQSSKEKFTQYLEAMTPIQPLAVPFSEHRSDELEQQLESLKLTWSELETEIDQVTATQSNMVTISQQAKEIQETVLQLQVEYDEVIDVFLESGATAEQIAIVQRQPLLAERILRHTVDVMSGGESAIISADSLGRDIKLFGRVLNAMLEGNQSIGIEAVDDEDSIELLTHIADLFARIEERAERILDASPELFHVRNMTRVIVTDAQQILQQASVLSHRLYAVPPSAGVFQSSLWLMAALALMGFVCLRKAWLQAMSRHRAQVPIKVKPDRKAIERLASDVDSLAMGDLTISASAADEFTSIIADSLNAAIKQLRTVVSAISKTAIQVNTAAQETHTTAGVLASSAEEQAREISSTTGSMSHVAEVMQTLSVSASRSAKAAENTVSITQQGRKNIATELQSTRKQETNFQSVIERVKRLDESAQEINSLTGIVSGLNDKTHLLSLNIAIQASSAGESGRDFSVVADHIQQLGEEALMVARKMELAVSVIQGEAQVATDTIEVMRSTLLKNTRMDTETDKILLEVEQITKALASMIQEISDSTGSQAVVTSEVASRMKTMQMISLKMSEGSRANVSSVSELAEIANDMGQSIASFKLSETES